MRYIRFARLFFSLWGGQNVYELTDADGREYTDPPRHWWKTRISFSTAWAVAKIVHG